VEECIVRSCLTLTHFGSSPLITRDEIEQKGLEFGIHVANVQRDYVFGWFLLGVYVATALNDILILKGGNCFRKAYFPNTRFSADLDFSTEAAIDEPFVIAQFNAACQFVQDQAGILFDLARSQIRIQGQLDEKRRVFDVRVYFKDFYGNTDHIWIRLSIDITEFDKIYLPPQSRALIHPYSDAAICKGEVRCLKLEEMIANKLKCLLQRQHVPDVYDLVYSVFINRDIAVNRGEVLMAFFRKTIYQRSPGVARQLLLELPLYTLKSAWSKYIVAPAQGIVDFDGALSQFQMLINELFGEYPVGGRAAFAFFPSNLRAPIMQAGAERRLIRLTYDGVRREVEPYSLMYKQRRDGHGEEYLYVYDRTGGRTSGPGLKSYFNHKIKDLEILEERFEPRYPIELAKAGEFGSRTYFSMPFGSGRRSGSRMATLRHGWRYTIQCNYCSRSFKRMRRETTLRPHKDGYGNNCHGRRGTIVDQQLI
jgi:predicted nucleotidyltransferase component of viral defense system